MIDALYTARDAAERLGLSADLVSDVPNEFDNLNVALEKLYREYPFDTKGDTAQDNLPSGDMALRRIYSSQLLPLGWRRQLWHAARQTDLDLSWFREFRGYWTSVLGGRPLWGVADLYFLKNLYRLRFRSAELGDGCGATGHLQAWQRPEMVYQLLHMVDKVAHHEQLALLTRLFAQARPQSILEFGCGLAPIATSLCEFYPNNIRIYLADIQTLAFHYAAYRFRNRANVKPILLTLETDFALRLDTPVDAICCTEVFEHLPNPRETVERLHEELNPGGLLLFDYVLGQGRGMDTPQGLNQRPLVLDRIGSMFEVVHGKLRYDASMGLTIGRKR
jgi:predicted O-methyltransferase YrrM